MVIIAGNPVGKVFFLDLTSTLGRDEKCTVPLLDPSISRQHAKITFAHEQWLIQDLHSSNGTFVDFERISEKVLHGGEAVTIGSTTLKFQVANKLEKDFYERIFHIASRDELTNAFSKTFFYEIASNELARALLYSRPISICLMDIDHFKLCNDRCGHLGGDALLKEWVKLMQQNTRPPDVLGRIGGDEFALLLPDQNALQAEQLITRLMETTKQYNFIYEGQRIPITFSAGISTRTKETTDLNQLIKTADERLYAAKAAGRDRFRS